MLGKSDNYFTPLTYTKRILLTAMLFCVTMVATLLIVQFFVGEKTSRNILLLSSVIQNIGMFIAPSFMVAFMLSVRPISLLGLNRTANFKTIIAITAIYVFALPAMNQFIYWNSQMTLPASLSSLESEMRSLEEMAAKSTSLILNTDSIVGVIMGVLAIGLLTGFSEELFFRGTLQRVIGSGKINMHLSIWICAAIFSFFHFQFFGFLPRMVLGALFGYVFYWTGSIWSSAYMHALNNSIVVVTSYLTYNELINCGRFDKFGVAIDGGMPIGMIVSLLLTFTTIFVIKKYRIFDK